MDKAPKNLYPTLRVNHIQDPQRLWAIPFFGILVKAFICLPVGVELMFVNLANTILTLINSFYVLFTGKYWDVAYELNLSVLRLSTKVTFFLYGLTDKYPGFNFTIDDPLIALDISKPTNPNRFFAFPILGGIARFILLIPFAIYAAVIERASGIGVLASFFSVLFRSRYPESTYELARDGLRLSLAATLYGVGLSDTYPNFWISMNHQTIKIVLIILGVLAIFANVGSGFSSSSNKQRYMPHTVVEPSPFNQYTPGLQTQ